MGKFQKILERLISGSGTITYKELEFFLGKLGYAPFRKGKTSGSRVAFYHSELNDIIHLHKPHPGNELKDYQIKLIKSHLHEKHLI